MGGALSCLKTGGDGADGGGPAPQYSWDKRPKRDPADCMFKGLKGQCVGKAPGDIDGQQFNVVDCQDCKIYVCDNSAGVMIDDCTNCSIFVGPVAGSIFIRDCKDCRIIVACQQFRTRDCSNVEVLLCCTTLPIIEATSDIQFGCFHAKYFALGGQFSKAGLSLFNNNWARVHDFTPAAGETNWSLTDRPSPDWLGTFFADLPDAMKRLDIEVDPASSAVPITSASRPKLSDESVLVAFFHPAERQAKKFLRGLYEQAAPAQLVQTKEVTMQASDSQRVFGSAAYDESATKGPIIGLELNGAGIAATAKAICEAELPSAACHVSASPSFAAKEIAAFTTHADGSLAI